MYTSCRSLALQKKIGLICCRATVPHIQKLAIWSALKLAQKIWMILIIFFYCRCKKEYLKKEEMIANPKSTDRLCGFTMFIGELFLNLEVDLLLAMWKTFHFNYRMLSCGILNEFSTENLTLIFKIKECVACRLKMEVVNLRK